MKYKFYLKYLPLSGRDVNAGDFPLGRLSSSMCRANGSEIFPRIAGIEPSYIIHSTTFSKFQPFANIFTFDFMGRYP